MGRPVKLIDGNVLLVRRRALLLCLLGLWLGWMVASKTFMAHLAISSPGTAVRLGSSDPTALLNLAESSISPGKANDPEVRRRAREWAAQALRIDPLNARAFSILGQIAIGDANSDDASKLMLAAVGRSLHERSAIYWLLQQSFAREDYAASARCADILLRTRPQSGAALFPAMARMAEHENGAVEIKKLLARNPPWRTAFLSGALANMSNPRAPLDLLLGLKDTPFPPSTAELAAYLNFLIGKNLYELAYYTHLQFLPSEQLSKLSLLNNGSFTSPPSGLPYDWMISQGPGATIDVVARPGQAGQGNQGNQGSHERKGALFIEFGHGRVEFRPVTQLVMLSPGPHRLSGEYTGEIRGVRGLLWRVACAATPSSPIAQTPMFVGAETSWKSFELAFTISDAGCRAQYVSLALDARSASEQLVSGEVWYSNVAIERVLRAQSDR